MVTILQNFVKLACLEGAFLKIGFFLFRASLLSLTSSKNFMVICPVVSEISGGWYHPPPKITETTGHMTMKFLPDVKLSGEARDQKNF